MIINVDKPIHIPGVHFFRGIAALVVVLHHAYRFILQDYGESILSRSFVGGASGVQFFFVLSGFIIYYIHSHDTPTIKQGLTYLKKRVIRIYPLYWFVLIIVYLLLLSSQQWMPSISRDLGSFLRDALLIYSPNGCIVPVAWTLCHEVLFYSLFFVSFYLWNTLRATLISWASLSLILSLLFVKFEIFKDSNWFEYIKFLFSINHVLFALGVAVAWLIQQTDFASLLRRRASTFMAFGIIIYLAIMGLQSYVGFTRDYNSFSFIFERIGFGIASALILLGACYLNSTLWQKQFFVLLSDASYSIYLIHMFVQIALLKIIAKLGIIQISNEIIFSLISLAGIISGVILHKWIKKPLLRYAKRTLH